VTPDPGSGRNETEKERLDRNLQEMLGELRVALPGVQVLFAFLLVVPFNQRFADVTSFQKGVYFATLLMTAASAMCLIAPSVHHRVEFRRQNKKQIVETGNRIVIVGLGLLATAMTGAVLFVTDVLYDPAVTAIVGGAVFAGFAVLWYAVPLRRIATRGR
jgi:uncharacterized protein DUF6328